MTPTTSSVAWCHLQMTWLVRFFRQVASLLGQLIFFGSLFLGLSVVLLGFIVLRVAVFVSKIIQVISTTFAVTQEIALLGIECLAAANAQNSSPPSSAGYTEDIPAGRGSLVHSPMILSTLRTPLSPQITGRPFLFGANTNLPHSTPSTTPLYDGLSDHAESFSKTFRLGPVPTLSSIPESSQTIAERRQERRMGLGLPDLPNEEGKGSGKTAVDRILGIENRAPPSTPEETNNLWGVPTTWLTDQDGEEATIERESRSRDRLMRGSLKGVRVSEEFEFFFDM